jgi:hypothetical protein
VGAARTLKPAAALALATVAAGLPWVTTAPAQAISGAPGGAAAPTESESSSVSKTGATLVPYRPAGAHPVLTALSVPKTSTPGKPPKVTLKVSEPGVATVYVKVKITPLAGTAGSAILERMGWVHTERTLTVTWPSGAKLGPGDYHVLVTGQDHNRAALVELAHISRVVALEVKAPPPATPPPSTTAPVAGIPSPAQSAAEGAVFPVQGTFNFGGPENRFGAPRDGYIHEGQDVLTAEGTPVVAPYAGTITYATYQEGGAGYYLVEHTHVGFDFMYAHCMANSFAVKAEQTVTAGQQLCKAGQTGDATGPHLHFEMWPGGWHAPGIKPIDPLPYLEAWAAETH